jgi:hypothetical protein
LIAAGALAFGGCAGLPADGTQTLTSDHTYVKVGDGRAARTTSPVRVIEGETIRAQGKGFIFIPQY